GLELMEYSLDSESPVTGKPLRELKIPDDCNIVTILRKGDAIIPRGDSVLQSGDMVLALIKTSAEATVRAFLLGS
ncbi:MAG: TrkA C-terminal domain-containing protein, partial [Candidatus Acidiferrales bacterium]